jgi:hypothetical protein
MHGTTSTYTTQSAHTLDSQPYITQRAKTLHSQHTQQDTEGTHTIIYNAETRTLLISDIVNVTLGRVSQVLCIAM